MPPNDLIYLLVACKFYVACLIEYTYRCKRSKNLSCFSRKRELTMFRLTAFANRDALVFVIHCYAKLTRAPVVCSSIQYDT